MQSRYIPSSGQHLKVIRLEDDLFSLSNMDLTDLFTRMVSVGVA